MYVKHYFIGWHKTLIYCILNPYKYWIKNWSKQRLNQIIQHGLFGIKKFRCDVYPENCNMMNSVISCVHFEATVILKACVDIIQLCTATPELSNRMPVDLYMLSRFCLFLFSGDLWRGVLRGLLRPALLSGDCCRDSGHHCPRTHLSTGRQTPARPHVAGVTRCTGQVRTV